MKHLYLTDKGKKLLALLEKYVTDKVLIGGEAGEYQRRDVALLTYVDETGAYPDTTGWINRLWQLKTEGFVKEDV